MADKETFHPFGEGDCEDEVARRGNLYSSIYVTDNPFAKAALNPDLYLIVGRRGTGKTALTRYFSFQTSLPKAIHVPIGDAEGGGAYREVMEFLEWRIERSTSHSQAVLIWKFVIWSAILHELGKHDKSFTSPATRSRNDGGPDHLLSTVKFLDTLLHDEVRDTVAADVLRTSISIEEMRRAKEYAQSNPIIVSVDTLERYDGEHAMAAVAALAEFAKGFINEFGPVMQIKVFVPGEVYIHLIERAFSNTLKWAKSPMFLFWSGLDLIKMTSFRLWKYLSRDPKLRIREDVQWNDARDVYKKVWSSYFPPVVEQNEDAASYMLRHTQLRPRQFIYLCNEVASEAKEYRRFPRITAADVKSGVTRASSMLVSEVLNATAVLDVHAPRVLNALRGLPAVVPAEMLRARAATEQHSLSLNDFIDTAANLGAIGRVTAREDMWVRTAYSYACETRYSAIGADEYAIHPMFHAYLAIKPSPNAVPVSIEDPLPMQRMLER